MKELEHLVSEVAGGRLTRREFVVKAAALGLSASAIGWVLAACGTKAKSASTAQLEHLTPPATKPAKLFFFNWVDYMSPKVLKAFQKQYGIEVVETYYDSNEELAAKLKGGATGYDLINPTDFMVSILAKSGLLMPLDTSLIPNMKNVEPFLKAPPFDDPVKQGGKKYSVPHMFGTTGMGIRTDFVPQQVTSWNVLFDPANKQKIVMLNGERDVLAVGLFMTGHDPNTIVQTELDEAVQKLIDQKPLVVKYDSNSPKRTMIEGNPYTHCWDGDAVMAKRALGTAKIDYVLPDDGFMVWADGIAIPKAAPSPYWAHIFLNFIHDPMNAAEISNYTGYQSGNLAAQPYITDRIQKGMRPTTETLMKGHFRFDLGAFSRNYDDAWVKVKSA
jgi:spermidine/putrescine transport system substrate-binding protein